MTNPDHCSVIALLGSAAAGLPGDAVIWAGELPLWPKLASTLFVCVLVPVYWRHYGPANFLWFSDLALVGSLAALWLESPLLASMQAVSVILLELAWNVDFFFRALTGIQLVGLSKYMFHSDIPLFVRGLSLFHVWLPVLLLWLVYRLGYDSRAWLVQAALALVLLPLCYFFTDPKKNINWVFGPGEKPQQWMSEKRYLALLLILFPIGVYLPAHFVLQCLFAGY